MDDNYDLSEVLAAGKRKKTINQKKKGGDYERAVAKKLNIRFNTKEFSKTPGSGAFATTHTLPAHMVLAGDLITPQNFRFVVECKKGYNTILIADLFNPKCEVWKWAKKTREEADSVDREPIIIWKQDKKKDLVIISSTNSISNWLPRIQVGSYFIIPFQDLLEDTYFNWHQ